MEVVINVCQVLQILNAATLFFAAIILMVAFKKSKGH